MGRGEGTPEERRGTQRKKDHSDTKSLSCLNVSTMGRPGKGSEVNLRMRKAKRGGVGQGKTHHAIEAWGDRTAPPVGPERQSAGSGTNPSRATAPALLL